MTVPSRMQIPRRRRSPMMSSCMFGAVLALTPGTLTSADTTIYRFADAQGITVFGDRPGSNRQAVELHAVNTYAPVESKGPAAADATREETPPIYQSLFITVPGDGETIRRNGGNVRVTGRVEPELRAYHRAVLFVDGAVALPCQGRQECARSPRRTARRHRFHVRGYRSRPAHVAHRHHGPEEQHSDPKRPSWFSPAARRRRTPMMRSALSSPNLRVSAGLFSP